MAPLVEMLSELFNGVICKSVDDGEVVSSCFLPRDISCVQYPFGDKFTL